MKPSEGTKATPSGSATTAGTDDTTPISPRPSPRRSAGSSSVASVPTAVNTTANPTPRTTHTAATAAKLVENGSASAGTPSSTSPIASAHRRPTSTDSRGVAMPAATEANIMTPVDKPAPTVPAPAASRYIGTADNNR